MVIRRIDPSEGLSLDNQNQAIAPEIAVPPSPQPKIRKLAPNERIMLDQERAQIPAEYADPLYMPQKEVNNSASGLLNFGATDAARRAYEFSGNITSKLSDAADRAAYAGEKAYYEIFGYPEQKPQVDVLMAPETNRVSEWLTASANEDFRNANILAGRINEMNVQPTVDWEQVKKDPVTMKTLRFMAEQGLISTPEMLTALIPVLGLPTVMGTTAQSIIEDRQRNLGKDQRDVAGDDLLFATTMGGVSGGLEKIGALASTGLLDGVTKTTLRQIPKNALESGVEEAVTEGIQNPIEMYGSTAGTNNEMTAQDLIDSSASGALVGFGMGSTMRAGTDSVRALKNGVTTQPMDNGGVTPDENALNPDIPLLPPPAPAAPPAPNRDDLARMLKPDANPTTEENAVVQPETVKPPISGTPEIGDTIEHVDQNGQVIEGKIDSIQEGENGQRTLIVTDNQGAQNIVFEGAGETLITEKRPPNKDDLLSQLQNAPDEPVNVAKKSEPETIESLQADIDAIRANAKRNGGWNGMRKRQEQDAINKLSAFQQRQINESAAQAQLEPTEAQKEAGNYKKGHINFGGLDIAIENPKGSIRRGVDGGGNAWETTLPAHYGYVKRTEGADGDHLDVYVGSNPDSKAVFIIDQIDPSSKEFDETKIMLGFNTEREAIETYSNAFSDGTGVSRVGAISAIPMDEFKAWLKNGDTKNPMLYKPPVETQPEVTQEKAQAAQEPVSEPVNQVTEDDKQKAAEEARAARLSQTFERIQEAIDTKNADTLRHILGNLDNKKSRKFFEEKTGIKLPKTQRDTYKAIDAFVGIDEAQRQNIDNQKAEQREKYKANKELEVLGKRLSSMKMDTGETVREWLDQKISGGHNRFVKQKNGNRNEYFISTETGNAFNLSKFGNPDVWKYAKLVIEQREKDKPNAPEATNEPENVQKVQNAPNVQNKELAEPQPEKKQEASLQEQDYNGVRLYQIKVRNPNDADNPSIMWAVESNDNRTRRENGERAGMGDTLHATLEEAKKQADFDVSQREDTAKREALNAARKKEENDKAAAIRADTYNGFLDGKPENTKALIRKALSKQYNFSDGGVMSVRDRIESLNEKGILETSTIEENKIKPMSRMQFHRADQKQQDAHEARVKAAGKKTTYLVNESDLGKTAYDYAQHLLDQKSKPEPQQPQETTDSVFSDRDNGERKFPEQNFRVDLKKYTPYLYRETSFSGAESYIPGIVSVSHVSGEDYADTVNFALGQGNNKGVLLAFKSDGITGQIKRDKPALVATFERGEGEYFVRPDTTPPSKFHENLVGIRIDKSVKSNLSKGANIRFKNVLKDLESKGFVKTEDDKYVTYELKNPVQSKPDQEISSATETAEKLPGLQNVDPATYTGLTAVVKLEYRDKEGVASWSFAPKSIYFAIRERDNFESNEHYYNSIAKEIGIDGGRYGRYSSVTEEEGHEYSKDIDNNRRIVISILKNPSRFKDGSRILAESWQDVFNQEVITKSSKEKKASKTTETQESVPSEKQDDTDVAQPDEPKAKDKIEDFGDKIHGAKKDLWKDYAKSIGDELPDDLKDITLSKHFPEPNYDAMIANGVTTDVLAAIKAMRDIIPSKPQKSWKLKEWASKVKTVRELSKMMLDGKFTAAEIKERMNDYSKVLRGLVERMDLYSALGYPAFTKAKDWDVNRSDGVYENGKPLKGTFYFASYQNSYGNRFDTREQAVDFIRNKLLNETEKTGKKEVRFDVFRITKTGEIVIGKKIAAGKFINLKGGFKTSNEARLYMAENGDDLVAMYEKKKDIPPERRSTNDPRRGEDYRKGEDVSVETLAKTFGFRGIQFGNYVEQKRRAEDINNAYDAMKDMATILGLPENALSLEGTLGLAFGARGGGNFAAAHYERGQTVINLTKKSGAGSLAHEWFHTFDHHFGKRRDGKDVYITESAYIPTKEIRKEVTDAFADIVKAIKKTGIVQRSESIDKTRTKDYWSTDIEMAARSFEAYIIYKAGQKDASNDYLANVVGEDAWNASRDESKENSSYPYPTDKEMSETIAPAFDKLFDILETKDTDKGTAMFSLSSKTDKTDTKEFKKWFGDSKVVDADGKPLVVYHGTSSDFEQFRVSGTGEFGPGIYLTDSPDEASSYTPTNEREANAGRNVIPLYASIQNPFVVKEKASEFWEKFGGDSDQEAVQKAISEGYDGIIFERDEAAWVDGKGIVKSGNRIKHLVAFHPEQIKSVNNRGTFDPNDPRISFARSESDDTSFLRDTSGEKFNKAAVDKIVKALNKHVKKLGLPENSIVLFENIADVKNVPGTQEAAEGGYDVDGFHYKNLIYIAMTAKDYISTLNHEAVHYLKAAGAFTPAEWKALTDNAAKWRKKYNIDETYGKLEGYNEARLDEEAIAHALQDYSNKGVLDRIRNIIIKYFDMIKKTLMGADLNYKTTNDIFNDIMSGEIGRRRFDPEYDIDPLFSISPVESINTPAFRSWFGDSKVVDDKGDPLLVYHGTRKDFEAFNTNIGLSPGTWFTSDKKGASDFSMREGGNIMPVYLKIENPGTLHDLAETRRNVAKKLTDDTSLEDRNRMIAEDMKSKGFDGVIDKNSKGAGGKEVFIIFDPAQAKSKFNKGTFDPADDRVMFSLFGNANGKKLSKKQQLEEAIDALDLHNKDKQLRPELGRIASYVLHPRQIASLYDKFTPVFTEVTKMMQRRDKIVHDLSVELNTYNHLDKKRKDRVNAVLEIGRLSKETFKVKDGKLTVKNENHSDAIYSKKGDTITLDEQEKKAYLGVRKGMDDALDIYIESILEEYGFLEMGIKTSGDLIDALKKEKNKSVINQMQNALKMIKDIESAKRMGYIPLKRWGEIGITVRTKDGESPELVHFERVELGKFRKKKILDNKAVVDAIAELRKKYGKDYDIDYFEVKDFAKLRAKVDLSELDILAASSDMTKEDYDEVRKALADAMKGQGFRSHFFNSNDVSGYSDDFERALNDYAVSIAGHLARKMHQKPIEAKQKAIVDAGQTNLAEYAEKYVSYVTDPVEEFRALRQINFVWYLAGNLASGITNATQPFMVTAPWFKGMFSHGQIMKAMSKAYKDAAVMISIKSGLDVFNFDKAPDDVRDILKQADEDGLFIPLQTHDAMAIAYSTATTNRALNRRLRTAQDVLALSFTIPERTNRVVTYMSAYRFAIDPKNREAIMKFVGSDQLSRAEFAGKRGKEFAMAFAEYAVYSTQLQMGRLNRPAIGRGIGTLPTQFMSFSMQMMELMYRLSKVHGGKSGTALAMMLFMVVAMSGLKGIPFEDDIQDMIEAAYKRLTRTDLDIDTEMKKILTNAVGETMATAIMYGIPAALMNVDMSSRLGYGNLVPDDDSDLLGIWWDMLYTRPTTAMTSLARGETMQAFADVAPAIIKNPLQAYIWSQEGVKSARTGDTIISKDDLTKSDIALKAFGFTSSAISKERQRIFAQKRANTAVNDLRSDYYDKLARAYAGRMNASDNERRDDYEREIQSIYQEIENYNSDAEMYRKVIIHPPSLKRRVIEEVKGASANKSRKQARGEAEELKKVWGN